MTPPRFSWGAPPMRSGHSTRWLAAAMLALAATACTGGLAEPDATNGSLAVSAPPTSITALAVDVPETSAPLVVDPNVDPVLGVVPPEPAELLVQDSIAHLEYVAEYSRQAGVQVDVVVAAANPGLAPADHQPPGKARLWAVVSSSQVNEAG